MIPELIKVSELPHRVLPPGIHATPIQEFEKRFTFNDHRRKLFGGLQAVTGVLWNAGCTEVYLGGSFVTDKPFPQDYDGCWNPIGVDFSRLDPVLLNYDNGRIAQKTKYLGEMFIATLSEASGKTFLEFFQIDKNTGSQKGVILIQPNAESVAP